ncbi:MAG: MBL fold metallo-hydrolase, partial [Armatimonadota bacterium]|nr:MBL fold metallo-hydrolase [Armatimonadota bacterium]
MKITYFGHACFLLESREGKRILIDPFNDQVGYPVPRVAADLVLVSHEHFDHNYVEAATGSPRVIRGLREGGREHA